MTDDHYLIVPNMKAVGRIERLNNWTNNIKVE